MRKKKSSNLQKSSSSLANLYPHLDQDCSSHSASLLCDWQVIRSIPFHSFWLLCVGFLDKKKKKNRLVWFKMCSLISACLRNQTQADECENHRSPRHWVKRGWISHLHLSLRQIRSELLGCTDNLPLMSQQVHPEVLDVIHGEPAHSV